MRWDIFHSMMRFLYLGELSVPADRKGDLEWLLELLRVSDEFMLDSVKEVCEKLICENVKDQHRDLEARQEDTEQEREQFLSR